MRVKGRCQIKASRRRWKDGKRIDTLPREILASEGITDIWASSAFTSAPSSTFRSEGCASTPPPSDDGFSLKDAEKTNEQTSNPLPPFLIHPLRGFLSDILNACRRLRNGDAQSGIVRSWGRQKCPMLPQRICAFYTSFLHMFLFHNVIYNPVFQMCDEVWAWEWMWRK